MTTTSKTNRSPRSSSRPRASAPKQVSAPTGEMPFTETFYEILSLAEALAAGDPSPPKHASRSRREGLTPTRAKSELQRLISALPAESVTKLFVLFQAGRDGRDIGRIDTALVSADDRARISSKLCSEHGPRLLEYLRRGHAIACATALDLEAPLPQWTAAAAESLEERVWLRFGQQLALNPPETWKCLGTRIPEEDNVAKLYLQSAGKAWWSFRRVLDRPSPEQVKSVQRRRAKASSPRALPSTLADIAALPVAVEHRALRRALRAIRARMGLTSARARTC